MGSSVWARPRTRRPRRVASKIKFDRLLRRDLPLISGKLRVLRYPSLRAPLDILFLMSRIALTADVLVPEYFGETERLGLPALVLGRAADPSGKGSLPHRSQRLFRIHLSAASRGPARNTQLFRQDTSLFMPVASECGRVVDDGAIRNAMTGSGRIPGPWLFALPGFVTISFVFDMFDLGQPNLVLLAMMLFGFWLLQHERPWMAGSMFALATAIKVFPVAVFPYLLWRRQWAAVASMIVFLGILLFVVPAPLRGYQHNISELKTWFQGMVGSSSEQGFGQRGEQNWSWVNQSIIAVTHRLTRPVNYNQDNPAKPPRYGSARSRFQDREFGGNRDIVGIGLGYVAVMPARSRITPLSNAEELGILFCLMTVASPLARQYYFMWLFFPMTILIHRAAFDPRAVVRAGSYGPCWRSRDF